MANENPSKRRLTREVIEIDDSDNEDISHNEVKIKKETDIGGGIVIKKERDVDEGMVVKKEEFKVCTSYSRLLHVNNLRDNRTAGNPKRLFSRRYCGGRQGSWEG